MNIFEGQSVDTGLSPDAVQSYLGATGWSLESATDTSQIWELYIKNRPEARIRLPIDRALDDFSRRFNESLARLCRVNSWNLDQLISEILGARSDFMYIRADQAAIDGSIPLIQAEAMLSGAHDLLLAAASSAVRPQSEHRGRRPDLAREFVADDLRMGHTQRGSFIITVLTRLGDDEVVGVDGDATVAEAPGKGDGPDALSVPMSPREAAANREIRIPPFQRRVMSTLATGLASAREIALDTGSQTVDDAVRKGLSANLVAALSHMTTGFEGLRSLDLSFGWAVAEELAPPPIREVKVDRTVMPALPELRTRLERRPKEPATVTAYGQVTRLERGEDDDRGVVTVTGVVGETKRSVRLELTGDLYNQAIKAHRTRTTVTVTGVLVKRGNANWLEGELSFSELR